MQQVKKKETVSAQVPTIKSKYETELKVLETAHEKKLIAIEKKLVEAFKPKELLSK